MTYKYSFDSSDARFLKLPKRDYQFLQEGFQVICSELAVWNQKSLESGARYPPYEHELNDLQRMIEWGNNQLKKTNVYTSVVVEGISVGSMRYCKAALIFLRHKKTKEISEKKRDGWPSGALQPLIDNINTLREIEQFIEYPPADILWEVMPRKESQAPDASKDQYDVFISHASEDKEDFVRPLALKLHQESIKVWFDEFTLKVGDSLRRSIDKGLSTSRFGVVVLSHNFFNKEWPQKELDGLVALESDGKKVILPVWHNIAANEIRSYSPMLADRIAVTSRTGLNNVVKELIAVIRE